MAAPEEKSFCVLECHTSNSVDAVQHSFRAKYAKDPPTDKAIRAWYKQFTEIGCLCKQKSSGRPLTAEEGVERVRASFLHSPKKSRELQLRSYRCQKQQCGGFCASVWCLNHTANMENIMKRPGKYIHSLSLLFM
jgi:hypothetical protein